ncbi:MAG: hypothetical protein NTY20_04405 [Candidatus Aenigmarchaeota archaeon]|nr:hypothetical protein [Candidatus Aenigmarchaeota archaeon]
MVCPYLKKEHKRVFAGKCESPEGPLLNDLRPDFESLCEEYSGNCPYYREAQTERSRLWRAFFSRK